MKNSRAQIFQPFDALKGFDQYLRQKEKIIVLPKQLSEDDYEKLNYLINKVQIGNKVMIEYYDGEDYVKITGIINKLELEYKRYIKIEEKIIYLKQIINIFIC